MAHFDDTFASTDRVVMITGAGAGIGRASALKFAEDGATVVVTDVNRTAADSVAHEIRDRGGKALAAGLDVADEREVDAVTADILGRTGRIDVLVNNAGVGARRPTVDFLTADWRRVLAVGLDGTFFCARAVGRQMVAHRRGAVVNVSSIMGLTGGGLYPNPAYHTAKGAIVNLTRALALEWAPFGIRVNAVAPAFVRTALVEPLMADPAISAAILDGTPLGRLVEADEVADAIMFLASDAASMITGHTLPVDGGWLAR
jgi:NAD(P)-dependent dehydrogenase (short-subunit alcohol dehydrogenase family)